MHESIEFTGLGKVVNNKLEETTVSILQDIGVGKIEPSQVYACHRPKNPNKTIIRFISRKYAALTPHGLKENVNVFINDSLCKPMSFLHYKVRLTLEEEKIRILRPMERETVN